MPTKKEVQRSLRQAMRKIRALEKDTGQIKFSLQEIIDFLTNAGVEICGYARNFRAEEYSHVVTGTCTLTKEPCSNVYRSAEECRTYLAYEFNPEKRLSQPGKKYPNVAQ